MASETVKSTRVTLKLDTGETTSTGGAKTVSVSLGTLSNTGFDVNKVDALITALLPVFTYSYVSATKTLTSSIDA